MPVTLAIETSQRLGSVALRAEDQTIHVEHLVTQGRHGDDLMPAVDRLFRRVEAEPAALGAVAVSIGPGSFTGLRIAVSTAKMLAQTLEANVIAVPSALVAAESFDPTPFARLSDGHFPDRHFAPLGTIVVALASKRESFWATRLTRIDGRWVIVGEPGLADAPSLDLSDVQALVADEYLPAAARALAERAKIVRIAPTFDAAACLRVAERMAEEGLVADPLTLLPLYPRPPEAVSIWEARHERGEASR